MKQNHQSGPTRIKKMLYGFLAGAFVTVGGALSSQKDEAYITTSPLKTSFNEMGDIPVDPIDLPVQTGIVLQPESEPRPEQK